MFKFFSKIRQQLITQNRFSKYLLYAVGEIVLVVIGILIALQVNNWNEERKEVLLENIYLERLITEIKSDTLSFTESIRKSENFSQILNDVNLVLNDSNSSDSLLVRSVYNLYNGGMNFGRYTPSLAIFEDISSTGRLKIIRNDTLRNQIINLYKLYDTSISSAKGFLDTKFDFETRLWYEHDFLRHLRYTQNLFLNKSISESANYINQYRDYYIRQSAFNFLIKKLLININNTSLNEATKVLKSLQEELDKYNK